MMLKARFDISMSKKNWNVLEGFKYKFSEEKINIYIYIVFVTSTV